MSDSGVVFFHCRYLLLNECFDFFFGVASVYEKLLFEYAVDSFGQGILVTVVPIVHRWSNVVVLQQLLVVG